MTHSLSGLMSLDAARIHARIHARAPTVPAMPSPDREILR